MGVEPAVRALGGDLLRLHPAAAARVLEGRSLAEAARVLEGAPPPIAAAVLERVAPEVVSRTMQAMSEDAFRGVISAMDPALAAPILSRLDAPERERRLALLDAPAAAELRELARFPPDTAGSLMDPRTTTFRTGTSVGEALSRLRAQREREFDDVYLLDEEGILVGTVPLEQLAVSEPGRRLDDLPGEAPVAVRATSGVEEVLELAERVRGGLAVVDFEGRLVGVIRPASLRAAGEERVSIDVQRMVGVSGDERALSGPLFAVRKRLPWLHVNLATAFLAATVVGLFEDTIARITALAVLQPVVAGQSGNSGAQALAVTMRGLALREVRLAHWRRLVFKEARVGLVNGLAIAAVTAAGVLVWSRSPGLALVIGVAMVISMSIAGAAGASVPMVLKALGQDPVTASSIVLTTVTDVVGFASFLGLATVLVRII